MPINATKTPLTIQYKTCWSGALISLITTCVTASLKLLTHDAWLIFRHFIAASFGACMYPSRRRGVMFYSWLSSRRLSAIFLAVPAACDRPRSSSRLPRRPLVGLIRGRTACPAVQLTICDRCRSGAWQGRPRDDWGGGGGVRVAATAGAGPTRAEPPTMCHNCDILIVHTALYTYRLFVYKCFVSKCFFR